MANEAIVLRDWSGGDEGRQRPVRNDTTQFRATNVWVYPSGGIGPRPPCQLFPTSGLPQKKLNVFAIMRPSTAYTYLFWGFSDGEVYRARSDSGVATSVGTMANPPINAVVNGATIYFVAEAGAGASCTDTGTITAVSDMPTGHYIAQFGARTVVSTLTRGVIAISEPDDPTTYNETIRVGIDSAILGLYVQRNTLVMPKFGGDIWVMRGVPTVNETLRQEDIAGAHGLAWRAPGAVAGQSNLWYATDRGMVKFTGAQAVLEDRPDLPALSGFNAFPWSNNFGAVLPLMDDDEFLLVGTIDKTASPNTKRVWMQARRPLDQWTRHLIATDEYVVEAGVPFTGATTSSESSEAVRVAASVAGLGFICTSSDTSGNGGRVPKVYIINSRQEYPHIPTGTVTTQGVSSFTLFDGDSSAPVIGDFRTAEYWDPKGRQLRVTDVVIDYSYNPNITPLATYNKFDFTVEAMQDTNSAVVTASTTQTFTPSGSGSTPDGSPIIRGQQRFGCGDQGAGLGFRVRLADWRGITVHGITVYVEATDGGR